MQPPTQPTSKCLEEQAIGKDKEKASKVGVMGVFKFYTLHFIYNKHFNKKIHSQNLSVPQLMVLEMFGLENWTICRSKICWPEYNNKCSFCRHCCYLQSVICGKSQGRKFHWRGRNQKIRVSNNSQSPAKTTLLLLLTD